MRMYTLHFGQGREHTVDLENQSLQNFPTTTPVFSGGVNMTAQANTGNSRIISHREIFEKYGVKGGHGEYCLETWRFTGIFTEDATRLFMTQPEGANALYIKFDFMYVNTSGGNLIRLQREINTSSLGTEDFTLFMADGTIGVRGTRHRDLQGPPPDNFPNSQVWPTRSAVANTQIESNEWHEIQIFIDIAQGWDVVADVGLSHSIEGLTPAFIHYEQVGSFKIRDAEKDTAPHIIGESRDIRMEPWPANGQPLFPNAMLPGQNQDIWPPENFGSGQYMYGSGIGLVYVWIDGQLEIQTTLNVINRQLIQQQFGSSKWSIWLGDDVGQGGTSDQRINGRFFYDNIICNDMKDHSGSAPSKIFTPLFSSDSSLVWNPNYQLKFIAMEIDPTFWKDDRLAFNENDDNARKHDTWLPEFPKGALVPSGQSFDVNAPIRFGSSTNSMIPHGTKLTTIHVDWNGDNQDYVANKGNRAFYADYDVDFTYQLVQPDESNIVLVNQDTPRLTSQASGNKALFYLKRPLSVSGKPNLPGGFGLGGPINYVPTINPDINGTLPKIYRIWTYIQDHTIGSNQPIDTQHHMIKVPSGISGSAEFISDNPCPGDRGYRAYHNGLASSTNGYSMADWPYNPVTDNPWTWKDLENLQIGVFHATHNGNNTAVVYTMYLVVEHSTSVNPNIKALNQNLLEFAIADDIPYLHQRKTMYEPRWRFNKNSKNRNDIYYNRWQIDPIYKINRTNRQNTDNQAIITGMEFSGSISFDYTIKYLNGEIVIGSNFRKFDEHFPVVWVYTINSFLPSFPIRRPHRGEVITDIDGNKFTFLTYPVLKYNESRHFGEPNASPAPLNRWPYILYDLNTMYVVPLATHGFADTIDPANELATWTPPSTRPNISGPWIIQDQVNAFNFIVDRDSYFDIFSPSVIANHILTHPNEQLNTIFPPSRLDHDLYFRAPNLASGSVSQDIDLTNKWSFPVEGIDNELYVAHIGLWQTTVDQAINDTGEGRFDFFDDSIIPQIISGYTFGIDGMAGWHLNETNITIPSGTRNIVFTFEAIRNTTGDKSPGGTFGGTSNFATFDEPFFIVGLSSQNSDTSFHPADINKNNRIESGELTEYIGLWQSGILPSGIAKDFVTKAEQIWQQGASTRLIDPSGGLYRDSGGARPDKWAPSGLV